ncbi:DegV family protein [Savagea sp. SN6]|uniref:DegV family protein n=1 Tax=Savagea serpentis TaxID=2785297 RepID=A0A8J7KKR2_9BACL|nr:DegV family protein [Savagea serpentis]MBF4500344.1 DegV family protein [Savagea serpentis]
MKMIHIVTDSTAELTEAEQKEYGIHVVPLNIFIDGKSYVDRVDLQPDEFLDLMRTSEELPKSSQPAVGVLKELYDELGKDGDSVISIHMTGGMSGTVKAAGQAASMTETDVTVIDSEYISFALGFQVKEAALAAKAGKTVEEVVAKVEEVKRNTTLFVVVDTLDNMVKGGRIGKGKAMLGSLLNIKPIARLEDGVYTPVGKARSYKQVASQLFKIFEEEIEGKHVKGVAIPHANGLKMAGPLKEKIDALNLGVEVSVAITTPIVSTHTGEGAIGFMYYTE